MLFFKGQTIFATKGKFAGFKGIITDAHISFEPGLYSVKLTRHEKEICLYETEIETVFSHDMAMLHAYKKMNI